jgi:superfamily II DNA helicase RecQ
MIPFVNPTACVLIIEPLNVKMQQQVEKTLWCMWLLFFKNVFQSNFFQKDNTNIVIDEVHCVMEWGEEF